MTFVAKPNQQLLVIHPDTVIEEALGPTQQLRTSGLDVPTREIDLETM